RLFLSRALLSTRSTMATGSLAARHRKSFARTYARYSKNAGRTGTLQRPNSKQRGSKATRSVSFHTAKRIFRLSVKRARNLGYQKRIYFHDLKKGRLF